MNSVSELCKQIRENGATPVLYATWAYKKCGKQLESSRLDYDEMYHAMYEAYHEAAGKNQALIADVGQRFYELTDTEELYMEDGSHPNERGSGIAAEIIAKVILEDARRKQEEDNKSSWRDRT